MERSVEPSSRMWWMAWSRWTVASRAFLAQEETSLGAHATSVTESAVTSK